MSTAKRQKRRQAESHQASASPLPASKRLKSSHVPAQQSGLGLLVDEDARAGKKLEAKLTNGMPRTKSTHVDESHTGVAPKIDEVADERKQKAEPEIIAISSGEEDSSELEEDDEDEDDAQDAVEPMPLTNGHMDDEEDIEPSAPGADDADMLDADEAEQQDEPTFGDLLQARHPDPIDVRKSLQEADQDSRDLVPMSTAVTGHSLGTVLSQALKNNDKDLLESCFAHTDLQTIRNTIQRQKSHEVAILLERIAERIHSKPGRTGSLLVWVQWSLIAHGGYLANQPELMKKVKSMAQVVRERAAALQPLLHLKGKLDMLSAQLEFRRTVQTESRAMNAEDMDDPNGVLYIEGADHDSSDSEDGAEREHEIRRSQSKKSKQLGGKDEADEDMDTGLPNGLGLGAENESSDEEDADLDGLVDAEAEEGSENDEEDSSNEEAESDEEEDDDDEEASDEEDSDTIAVKQPRPNTLNRKR